MRIVKRFKIESTHHIPNHPVCGDVHGHSFKVWIEVEGEVDKYGMLVDFGDLKAGIQPIIDTLDHTDLNRIIKIPTAENIILYIKERAMKKFPNISRIRVQETEDNYAEWP